MIGLLGFPEVLVLVVISRRRLDQKLRKEEPKFRLDWLIILYSISKALDHHFYLSLVLDLRFWRPYLLLAAVPLAYLREYQGFRFNLW